MFITIRINLIHSSFIYNKSETRQMYIFQKRNITNKNNITIILQTKTILIDCYKQIKTQISVNNILTIKNKQQITIKFVINKQQIT